MDTPDIARLEVHATHARPPEARAERARAERSLAEAFWAPLFEASHSDTRPGKMPSIAFLEARVSSALPRHLKYQLERHFQAREWLVVTERAKDLLPRIGIGVGEIRYGSLDLAIEFTGVKHLVELFDSNFDLFMMFARAYLPVAFSDTMRDLALDPDGQLIFQLAASPGLVRAFSPAPAAPTPAPSPPPTQPAADAETVIVNHTMAAGRQAGNAGTAALDRAKALWQISNFSLVVPVALALLVLYVYAKSLSDDRRDLRAWQTSLTAREQAQARATQERIAQLEKVQGELLVLAKGNGDKPAEKKK